MDKLVQILLILAFMAGVIGIAALWVQHDINRKKEQDGAAPRAREDQGS